MRIWQEIGKVAKWPGERETSLCLERLSVKALEGELEGRRFTGFLLTTVGCRGSVVSNSSGKMSYRGYVSAHVKKEKRRSLR